MLKKLKERTNSFKVKITFWFSLMLLCLCIIIFMAVFITYRYTQEINVIEKLTLTVENYTSEFQEDDDLQDIFMNAAESSADELFFYSQGVFVAIYDENGNRCSGYFLPGEDQIPFKDYDIQETFIEEINCCVYDRKINTKKGIFWIRGVIYADFEWNYVLEISRNILYLIPVTLLFAWIVGYFLARRFLRPISKIVRTAEEIRTGGNLSKRIEIENSGDELGQLSETFNSMFEKLQKNFEAKREFTSNASHELRTPVAVIQAQCEYAIENVSDPEELWEVITAIQKQGYRMSKLLENLLVLTRIEQKSEIYPAKEENINEIIRRICADWQTDNEKNINLYCEMTPDVKRSVNGELLRILVNNLIQNAFRYGKKNGNVYVRLYEEDKKAVIKVRDDGKGISADELPRIWERFYRIDKSRSKKGLGLGLSLVKQITEYYGGSVNVSSEEGKGTEFCVKF